MSDDMRVLAESLYSDLRSNVDTTQKHAAWHEVESTIVLASERLYAARLVLDLPASDPRYADAPAVAIEVLHRATMLYGMAAGALFGEVAPKRALTALGRGGAAAKHAADPKQLAKTQALGLWLERHAGAHPRLRTVEQFATEVMHRWPVLTSSKVICGWSAQWTREVSDGKHPASR